MPFLRGGVHPTVLIRSGKGVREWKVEIETERERGDKQRTGHSLCFLRCELGEFWVNGFRMERKSLDATPGLAGR